MSREASEWWLADAEELHHEYPETFLIPPADKRASLRKGDDVKLVFRFEPPTEEVDAERMWVTVQRKKDGDYVGVLLNDPEHITNLRKGDEVPFGPQHVASYAYSEDELGFDPGAVAVVSRRIRDEDALPLYVYRVDPEVRDGTDDSGWRLYGPDDDDEFISDPENILWWELGWIADRFPQVEELLRSEEDVGEWVWNEEVGRYWRRK